jgi:hypothetical protein
MFAVWVVDYEIDKVGPKEFAISRSGIETFLIIS